MKISVFREYGEGQQLEPIFDLTSSEEATIKKSRATLPVKKSQEFAFSCFPGIFNQCVFFMLFDLTQNLDKFLC
jgi:hypothetical protein